MRTLFTLLTLFTIPFPIWGVAKNPDSTRLNILLGDLTSGAYAQSLVSDFLDQIIPFWNAIPLIEIAPIDEEFNRFVKRETTRQVQRFVQEEIGIMGLSGPLSLADRSGSAIPPARRRGGGNQRPVRLRAQLTTHHMGVSLFWRF